MSGILILSATEFEVAGFLKEFPEACKKVLTYGGHLYTGPGWHCLVTGPGVFNTAMGLGAYLEHHTPDLILDTGIAGAFESSGLAPGQIAVADQEQYLHTGVGNDPLSLSPLPFELIPGCPESCSGIYPFDPEPVGLWQARMETELGAFQSGILKGPFLTVSAITRGRDRAQLLYDRFAPIMESMEGAAAAHVAACCGLPMVEIRSASNMVGERDKQLWEFNRARDGVKNICLAALA